MVTAKTIVCHACGRAFAEKDIAYHSTDDVTVCQNCLRNAGVFPQSYPKEVFLVNRLVRKDQWSAYKRADHDASVTDFAEIQEIAKRDPVIARVLFSRFHIAV